MARKKIYYPEGEIQRGLYTEGKEWMLEDGTEYIGDYHRYITNEVFTLSSYILGLSKKLIPYLDLSLDVVNKKFEYDLIKQSEVVKINFINYGKPTPTENDYTNGFYNRFFLKRHFQSIITEVDLDSFEKANEIFYLKLTLPWKLTGKLNDSDMDTGIFDTNRRLVLLAEMDMEGIRNYVTDYIEYARVSQ
jgi:hypothetical protein